MKRLSAVRVVVWFILALATGLTTLPSLPVMAAEAEPSLEPEFRQLREQLKAEPAFQGADAQTYFRLAEALAHRGDMFGAIQSYRAAIQADPIWADPYRGLGRVLLDHHDYAEAAEAFQSSIRLGSGDAQIYYWLSRASMGTGDLVAAEQALVRATELNADDAEAYADLGLVRMAQGDLDGADRALTRAIHMKPDLAEAHRLSEMLAKHRDPAAARSSAKAILHDLFERE